MRVVNDIGSIIEGFVRAKRSGVLLIKRSAFKDPFLTAYFYKGKLLHATSFVAKRMWWEGILSDEEVLSGSESGNLFRYAAERYGEAYLDHLVSHAKVVVRESLEFAGKSGWEILPEVYPMEEDELERMFGLDIIREAQRRREAQKEGGAPVTTTGASRSIVLSLISGSTTTKPSEGEAGRRETKEETSDIVLTARALGFFVLYVPGEDNRPFLSTLREISETFSGEFHKIRKDLQVVRGTVAIIFPLFAVIRFGPEEVWGITSDAKKIAYALKYMDEAENVPKETLDSLSAKYGAIFAWREGEELVIFGRCKKGRMSVEEFLASFSGYFDRFRDLIDKAVEKMPVNMPMRLRKIHLLRMLRRCPTPDEFKKEFYAKFGIKLEG